MCTLLPGTSLDELVIVTEKSPRNVGEFRATQAIIDLSRLER